LLSFVTRSLPRTGLAVVLLAGLSMAAAMVLFRLRLTGAFFLYFVIWWTLLFAALPFGVRSQAESGEVVEGSEPGAPALPFLREKAVWTSLAAGLALLVAAWVLALIGP
jgi:predicted secreted protein